MKVFYTDPEKNVIELFAKQTGVTFDEWVDIAVGHFYLDNNFIEIWLQNRYRLEKSQINTIMKGAKKRIIENTCKNLF